MKIMGHELPLSHSMRLDKCLNKAEKCVRAGFEATECILPTDYRAAADLSGFPQYLKDFHDHAHKAGLRVHSYHIPFGTAWDISEPDEEKRAVAVKNNADAIMLVRDYEGVNVVLHPSFEPISEETREAHILACKKSLAELAPIAKAAGKRIALENLPRTCLGRTSDEMLTLTENGALCSICMDTTHMFHETPQEFIAKCGKWIINTHLSDYLNGEDECHWVPGTGSLNWRAIVECLIDAGYKGTYNFELTPPDPLEIMGGFVNALKR